MACILFDGFDLYPLTGGFPSSNIQSGYYLLAPRWTTAAHTNGFAGFVTGASTRFGAGRAWQFKGGDYLGAPLASLSRVIFGFAIAGVSPATSKCPIWALYDGTTCQLTAAYDTDGSIKVYRGSTSGTQVAATSASALIGNLWSFVEFDITIHSSTGAVGIWVEQVQLVNATGLNTQASGTAQATQFRLGADTGSSAGGFGCDVDDFYLLDTTGSSPWNARLGDIRVLGLFPNAAGDSTQFAPDGGFNWSRVGSEDEDSSYVQSRVTGNKDLYNVTDLDTAFSGSVLGACHVTRWKKEDAGSRTVRQIQKSGSTTTTESTMTLYGDFYQNTASTYVNNPATGSPYTGSEINALQIGFEVMGGTSWTSGSSGLISIVGADRLVLHYHRGTGLYTDDGVTAATTNGQSIYRWSDLSGYGRHAYAGTTSPTLSTGTQYLSANTVRFTGGAYFTLPSLSFMHGGELFIVIQVDADPPGSSANTGLWTFGTSGQSSHYVWTDGHIYDDFGTTSRKDVGNPTPSLTSQFRVYSVRSGSGDWEAFLDNTSLFSTTSNTTGFTSAPTLGVTLGGQVLVGNVAALALCQGSLTSTERTAVYTALTT